MPSTCLDSLSKIDLPGFEAPVVNEKPVRITVPDCFTRPSSGTQCAREMLVSRNRLCKRRTMDQKKRCRRYERNGK